jgi:hypothetical protein
MSIAETWSSEEEAVRRVARDAALLRDSIHPSLTRTTSSVEEEVLFYRG